MIQTSLKELLLLSGAARQLSFSAMQAKSVQSGGHISRLLGRGMEFAESRRYQTGDDIRNIDWKVTARTGKAHTKLFSAEKERQVLLCVDMRKPMFFATRGVFKSVQAATFSSYVTWNAVQEGNRIGGIIFGDKEHVELRPSRGRRGALRFLQALANESAYSEEKKKNALGDMDDALSRLKRVTHPGSLVFVVSDFRKMTEKTRDLLAEISRQSDVVLCMVYDQIEADLPKNGVFPVTDGQKELRLSTYKKHYLDKFAERMQSIETLCYQHKIRLITCQTQDDCYKILLENFGKRRYG